MNEQPVIRTRGLTRYFGVDPAVYELNLEVPRGGVFALLGRNGSGKTRREVEHATSRPKVGR